jgi:hypothetical protein
MALKYEKPLLKPFRLSGPDVGHGQACAVGGNASGCGKGANAMTLGCNPGTTASPTCTGGTTVTAS